jgi:2-polyprenyl-6-methoxyphenol hydroxylase-like FAD-dependent oxidoreductase
MAIEDAVVLAEELSTQAGVDAALSAYSARRGERVKRVFDISLAICQTEQDPNADPRRAVELLLEGYGALAEPF